MEFDHVDDYQPDLSSLLPGPPARDAQASPRSIPLIPEMKSQAEFIHPNGIH